MDIEQYRQIIEIGFQVIGVASAVAAVVPIPQVAVPLILARKVLDILAMNVGSSKNAAP